MSLNETPEGICPLRLGTDSSFALSDLMEFMSFKKNRELGTVKQAPPLHDPF
jgi:hypothetical protein